MSLSAGFVLISLAFTKWLTETGQSDVDNLRNFPDQDYPYKNILSIVSEMIVQDTTTINLFINEGTYLLNKISSLQKKGSLKSKARAYEILRQSLIVYNEKCKKLAEEIAHINEHSKGGGRK